MTAEIVEYISDLDEEKPKGSDKISYGDDHIRNIKRALKETFPDIDGPVNVDQDKLNEIPAQLPVAPTEEGSMLHNEGDVWSETTTLKIVGDKAIIPGLAGLGNLNLYVNNDGEIVASEIATDPTVQHDIEFHTDVSYPSAPEEDDILMFNGSEWVNTPNRSGNMFKPCNQDQNVGSYWGINGSGWQASQDNLDADGKLTFKIPSGFRFALVSVSSTGQYKGAGFNANIWVDDVPMNNVAHLSAEWPSWTYRDVGGPTIECKEKIEIKWDYPSADAIIVQGYFFEV